MKKPILALLACVLCASFYAIFYGIAAEGEAEKSWVFMGYEIEPFFFKSGSQGTQGAVYDLTQEVCKIKKKHCKFKIGPFRSAQDMVAKGRADISGPMAFTPQRTILFHYSTPLFATEYCFFTLPKNYKDHFTLDDMKDRTVGVFGPSATELSLQRVKEVLNQHLKIIIEPDNNTSLRKAESNAYEFSYVNCQSGRYWVEKNRSPLKEVSTLGEKTIYYIIFSKKTFTDQDVAEFNAILETLRKNGFLQELADRYKLTLAEIGK